MIDMIAKIFPIAAILLGSCIAQAQMNPLPVRGICAHRGAMDTHPENTIAAFKEAIRLGVQMIEFDVRMTADGYLVILHDETVDRTTDGQGNIESLTLEQVRTLDAGLWKSIEFKGEKIPTLEETLDVMTKNILLNIHLKGGADLGMKTAEMLVKKSRTRQAFIACGSEAANGARLISKDIMICNMERQSDDAAYISGTIKSGSQFIQLYNTPVGPQIDHFCAQLKAHSININYCCTDDPNVMKGLFESGVDFVLVNQPGAMLKAAREMGYRFDSP